MEYSELVGAMPRRVTQERDGCHLRTELHFFVQRIDGALQEESCFILRVACTSFHFLHFSRYLPNSAHYICHLHWILAAIANYVLGDRNQYVFATKMLHIGVVSKQVCHKLVALNNRPIARIWSFEFPYYRHACNGLFMSIKFAIPQWCNELQFLYKQRKVWPYLTIVPPPMSNE